MQRRCVGQDRMAFKYGDGIFSLRKPARDHWAGADDGMETDVAKKVFQTLASAFNKAHFELPCEKLSIHPKAKRLHPLLQAGVFG